MSEQEISEQIWSLLCIENKSLISNLEINCEKIHDMILKESLSKFIAQMKIKIGDTILIPKKFFISNLVKAKQEDKFRLSSTFLKFLNNEIENTQDLDLKNIEVNEDNNNQNTLDKPHIISKGRFESISNQNHNSNSQKDPKNDTQQLDLNDTNQSIPDNSNDIKKGTLDTIQAKILNMRNHLIKNNDLQINNYIKSIESNENNQNNQQSKDEETFWTSNRNESRTEMSECNLSPALKRLGSKDLLKSPKNIFNQKFNSNNSKSFDPLTVQFDDTFSPNSQSIFHIENSIKNNHLTGSFNNNIDNNSVNNSISQKESSKSKLSLNLSNIKSLDDSCNYDVTFTPLKSEGIKSKQLDQYLNNANSQVNKGKAMKKASQERLIEDTHMTSKSQHDIIKQAEEQKQHYNNNLNESRSSLVVLKEFSTREKLISNIKHNIKYNNIRSKNLKSFLNNDGYQQKYNKSKSPDKTSVSNSLVKPKSPISKSPISKSPISKSPISKSPISKSPMKSKDLYINNDKIINPKSPKSIFHSKSPKSMKKSPIKTEFFNLKLYKNHIINNKDSEIELNSIKMNNTKKENLNTRFIGKSQSTSMDLRAIREKYFSFYK